MRVTDFRMLVRRCVALSAVATTVWCATASAAIVYVDAREGAAGNTALAAGGTFTGTGDPAATGTDNLWRKRAFASSATVFESNGQGAATESAPRLVTTATGVPAGNYKVYGYFWSPGNETADNQQQWMMRFSLSNPGGDLPLWSRPYGVLTTPTTADFIATQVTSTAGFSTAPTTVSESSRFLYKALVGVTSSTGTISLYVDDFANPATVNKRSWYDGIGYELVPEPGSLALAMFAAPFAMALRRRVRRGR